MTMSEEQDAVAKKIRFFNVSLINAVPMSLPKLPQPQRLIGELIHSIEAAKPTFAWVQFLFKRVNLSPTLIALKNSMHVAAEQIKTPRRSVIDDSEYDRPELYRDWYRRSGERVKRIDAIANKPHVLLAIQGMWVGDPRLLSTLPFKDCHDELDRLGTFVYRNPWMLAELVDRRMVVDVSPYFMSYARSRLESPSFLITQEEIPYYLHLPVAKSRDFLKSITERTAHTEIASGRVEGSEDELSEAGNSRVMRLAKVPEITEPLKEDAAARLGLLPSPSARGFEVLFEGAASSILLSARSERDLMDYKGTLESVYGALSTSEAPAKPGFLKEIPGLLNLRPPDHSGPR